MTGESPPRTTCATAAPLAPVPLLSVSPTPRSKIRARIASGAISFQNETLVRLGKIGAFSISGPSVCRSSASGSSTRIAHCGLPIATCWKR